MIGGGPKFQLIADDLRARIANGEYAASGQLPTMAKLKIEYKVAINTVDRAVEVLRREGLVASSQGSGIYVLEPPKPGPDVPAELAGLRSEVAELREQVRAPDAELLERLGAVEAALMDLYAKSGYEYPGHAPERGKRKAAGK
jgi:DNA-binding GntR family transcriptional regulator